MDRIRRMLGCDLENTLRYTGRGVYVAVLDSGVASHPDLRGRVVEFADFTGERRTRFSQRGMYDDNGHGTHVCGILAGNGAASKGKYRGIAPECLLLCGKVLDKKGGGSLKNLISGLQWVMEMKKSYPIRVLNISIEVESDESIDREEWVVLKRYLELLWALEVVIVAAAGNRGPGLMTLSPISECARCICVGCHDGDYSGNGSRLCKEYSSRGPGRDLGNPESNPLNKPDIVAPGTDIVSCNSKYMLTPYVAKSGTSMSAPIVSGACALCLQKYPKLAGAELRRMLVSSAKDLGESRSMQGAGLLQIDRLLANNILN
ncbi:MAG: S8 family peptidase [Lachnospiraceae bacterium]|nr:S8 family peptidase [Lachnospiraceae bacterium]